MQPATTLVHSYLFLRRAVGVLGLALPFVLVIGTLLAQDGMLLYSISGYYYSDLRDVYVGTMCAVGVFLLSYRGYEPIDDVVTNVAAVAAIGVALFPTTPADHPTRSDQTIGALHLTFAALFLVSLAVVCLWLFTKSDTDRPTGRKVRRNGVYIASGVTILLCLALIVVCGSFFNAQTGWLHPSLWLESAATIAFGVAWLVKGEVILRDLQPAVATPAATPAQA